LLDPATASHPSLLKKHHHGHQSSREGEARINMYCPDTSQEKKKLTLHPKAPSPPRPARTRGTPRRLPTSQSSPPPRPAKNGPGTSTRARSRVLDPLFGGVSPGSALQLELRPPERLGTADQEQPALDLGHRPKAPPGRTPKQRRETPRHLPTD
jgi:hypothetical protein